MRIGRAAGTGLRALRARGDSRAGRHARGCASMSVSPAAGPSRIATATARFNSITGDGSIAQQHVVERDDLVPIGGFGSRPHWRARPRSLPGSCTDRCAATRAPAPPARSLRDLLAIPERAVLVLQARSVHRSAAARAARRDSCSSISASRPDRLGLGQQLDQQPSETYRLAGQIEPRHRRRPTTPSSPR